MMAVKGQVADVIWSGDDEAILGDVGDGLPL
jgi:hypothetical protein